MLHPQYSRGAAIMKSFSAIQDLDPLFWRSAITKSFRAVTVFLRVSGRHKLLEKERYLKPEASTCPGSPTIFFFFSGRLFFINSLLKTR